MLFVVTAISVKDRIIVATWIVSSTIAAHAGMLNTPLSQFAITNRSCETAEVLLTTELRLEALPEPQMFHPRIATTALLICLICPLLNCNMPQKTC
jgi:hypothetical protein